MVSLHRSLVLKDLHIAIILAPHFALNLGLELEQLFHVDFFAPLSSSLTLFLVLSEGSCKLLPVRVPGKHVDLLVLACHDYVVVLVVGHTPDRPWKLDCLLDSAIFPDLDGAVIASTDNLTRVQTIDCKDKATMASQVHQVSSIHGPQLHCLVV